MRRILILLLALLLLAGLGLADTSNNIKHIGQPIVYLEPQELLSGVEFSPVQKAQALAPQVAVSGDCASWLAEAGIPQSFAVNELIRRESNCRRDALNSSSGACGIPQALPCSKLPNGIYTSPVEQLKWMQNYVVVRYGSWEKALEWHNAHNWY